MNITHLQFADDALIFSSYNFSFLQNIKRILQCFELISSLKVNFYKSSIIGIGIDDDVVSFIVNNFMCWKERLPFKYLGLPTRASSSYIMMWKPIITKISSRLAAWKWHFLFIGVRVYVIKLVLNNLHIYYLFLYPIPIIVATKIENQIKSGKEGRKKLCNVKWTSFVLPKKLGGIGISSILNKKKALSLKWFWRYWCSDSGLWKNTICNLHN